MEINSKNLHKHALPVIIVAMLLVALSAVVLSRLSDLPRGLQTIGGQNSAKNLPDAGSVAIRELGTK